MTALFGIPLLAGAIGLVAWIDVVAFRSTGEGDDDAGASTVRGPWPLAIAALIGFGMAGISSLYGGWPTWATVLAATAGAVGLAAVTWWLGRSTED
jgi:hypothetical protein